jgi:hypothetical protein
MDAAARLVEFTAYFFYKYLPRHGDSQQHFWQLCRPVLGRFSTNLCLNSYKYSMIRFDIFHVPERPTTGWQTIRVGQSSKYLDN